MLTVDLEFLSYFGLGYFFDKSEAYYPEKLLSITGVDTQDNCVYRHVSWLLLVTIIACHAYHVSYRTLYLLLIH